MLMASTIVIFAIETVLCSCLIAPVRCCLMRQRRIAARLIALSAESRCQLCANIIEHRIGGLLGCRQVLLDRGIDLFAAGGLEAVLTGLVPQPARLQEFAHARDRLEPVRGGELFGTTVARGIIRC